MIRVPNGILNNNTTIVIQNNNTIPLHYNQDIKICKNLYLKAIGTNLKRLTINLTSKYNLNP